MANSFGCAEVAWHALSDGGDVHRKECGMTTDYER